MKAVANRGDVGRAPPQRWRRRHVLEGIDSAELFIICRQSCATKDCFPLLSEDEAVSITVCCKGSSRVLVSRICCVRRIAGAWDGPRPEYGRRWQGEFRLRLFLLFFRS